MVKAEWMKEGIYLLPFHVDENGNVKRSNKLMNLDELFLLAGFKEMITELAQTIKIDTEDKFDDVINNDDNKVFDKKNYQMVEATFETIKDNNDDDEVVEPDEDDDVC